MARIRMEPVVSAAILGAANIAADAVDKSQTVPLTKPFRRSKDYVGLLGVLLGAWGIMNNFQTPFSEGLFHGGVPLLEQSLWDLGRSLTTTTVAGRTAGYAGAYTARVAPQNWAPSSPAGGAYRRSS